MVIYTEKRAIIRKVLKIIVLCITLIFCVFMLFGILYEDSILLNFGLLGLITVVIIVLFLLIAKLFQKLGIEIPSSELHWLSLLPGS